jgi:hypothetical protein
MIYGGDIEGHPMDVWPVRVAAYGRGIDLGDEPARIDAQYVITDDPALNRFAPAVV